MYICLDSKPHKPVSPQEAATPLLSDDRLILVRQAAEPARARIQHTRKTVTTSNHKTLSCKDSVDVLSSDSSADEHEHWMNVYRSSTDITTSSSVTSVGRTGSRLLTALNHSH